MSKRITDEYLVRKKRKGHEKSTKLIAKLFYIVMVIICLDQTNINSS